MSSMAASSAVLSFPVHGGVHTKARGINSNKLKNLSGNLSLEMHWGSKRSIHLQRLFVHAGYGGDSRGGGGDFVAGFLLGGAVFGTLAYVFAPQLRRSLLNEDESGFRRARRPLYDDGGLEESKLCAVSFQNLEFSADFVHTHPGEYPTDAFGKVVEPRRFFGSPTFLYSAKRVLILLFIPN